MRIIAGIHRSRVLKTLVGELTRPTLDQVKESCFNKMGQYFNGGIVLDLFSGCGNIGLECISRGFDKAIMVDVNPSACSIINENVALLKEESKCKVICASYQQAIEQLKCIHFDFIYIDPPYGNVNDYFQSLNLLFKWDCIGNNTLIVLETDSQLELDLSDFPLEIRYEKKYRKAKLIYLRRK